MARKLRMFLVLLLVFTAVGITYRSLNPTYIGEVFFILSLSQTNAPISELRGGYYTTRLMRAITYVSADVKGHIYIAGFKDKKPRLVIIDPNGNIERTFYIHFKDGKHPNFVGPIAVSPYGDHIWIFCGFINPIKDWWEKRIIVYRKQGEIVAEWKYMGGDVDFLWVSGNDTAYGITDDRIVYSLKIGQSKPCEFSIPFCCPFLKDGKFWFIEPLEYIAKVLGKHEYIKGWMGVVTWSQNEGVKFEEIKLPLGGSIHWIDEKGNFYIYHWGHYSVRFPSFLTKIPFLVRILKAFGMSEDVLKPISPKILIFSPMGKLLGVVHLTSVIQPKRGEKLEYGQLIKADKRGIYLEVLSVSEGKPKEYRIIRIVKKSRWKVWWERLKRL